MKSEWRVTSNIINGQKLYGVYRLLDMGEVDHSGNREHQDNWFLNKEMAEAKARILNDEKLSRLGRKKKAPKARSEPR